MANKPSSEQRIRSLYQMLFEMATGNLYFQIPADNGKDELDELAILLNRLAERMRITFVEHNYVAPYYSYQNLAQLTFITDLDFKIISFTSQVYDSLGWKNDGLIGLPIRSIIADNSNAVWESAIKEISKNPECHETLHLTFVTPEKLLVPAFCTISRLLHVDMVVVSSVKTILQEIIYDLPKLKTAKPRADEAETMQQLHDYILDNLGEPLPTIKQLSRIFKVNEFDLKDGFRKLFRISIHRFYNEERLKRAHLMIVQTDESLKIIASVNGYMTYTSFNKAFKARFGYPPSSLKRSAEK